MKIILCFLSPLFILNITFGQIKTATRIGLSTFNELQIELSKPLEETRSLYSSFSYVYRGFNLNGAGCGTFWPASLYDKNNRGFTLKFGITKLKTKKKARKNKEWTVNRTVALSYRRFSGDLRINESGCSQYWYEYDFVANDLGLYHYHDREFNKLATFYWGFGYYLRSMKQTGKPSFITQPGTIFSMKLRLVIDLGFRISLN